jgi:hypothetical protein
MTYAGAHYMRDDPQLLSRRLALFVRPMPAKELAEIIECDERTAENIRRGKWPIARHWLGLVRAFGRDLTEAVFHPDEAVERLERECAELEAQIAAKRALARDVAGTVPVRPRHHAPHDPRAADALKRPRAP